MTKATTGTILKQLQDLVEMIFAAAKEGDFVDPDAVREVLRQAEGFRMQTQRRIARLQRAETHATKFRDALEAFLREDGLAS